MNTFINLSPVREPAMPSPTPDTSNLASRQDTTSHPDPGQPDPGHPDASADASNLEPLRQDIRLLGRILGATLR